LADFQQGSVIYSYAHFAISEFQISLCKKPVDSEFPRSDIFHILLFPSEHQDSAASDFQRNQRPTATRAPSPGLAIRNL
jgi:hypothetical protein